MKFISSFFLVLFLAVTVDSYAESNEMSSYKIQSISYETCGHRANILLDNGYQFVFAPKIEDEYLLEDLETRFPIGKEVNIDTNNEKPSYKLLTTDADEDGFPLDELIVFLSGETKKKLPSIEESEKLSDDEYTIELNDGTKWQSSSSHIEKWYLGHKVMIVKNSENSQKSDKKFTLINVDAEYAENKVFYNTTFYSGKVYYWDYRDAEANLITEK